MLSLPLLVLSLTIATLYSAVFHLLSGQTMRQLSITWLAGLLGFALGQGLAVVIGWGDIRIGELHLLAASVSCWLFMVLARRIIL
jgi:hypothetical protein